MRFVGLKDTEKAKNTAEKPEKAEKAKNTAEKPSDEAKDENAKK